jgi:hypothetical protein
MPATGAEVCAAPRVFLRLTIVFRHGAQHDLQKCARAPRLDRDQKHLKRAFAEGAGRASALDTHAPRNVFLTTLRGRRRRDEGQAGENWARP